MRELWDYARQMEKILLEVKSVLRDDLEGRPSLFKAELIEKIERVMRND